MLCDHQNVTEIVEADVSSSHVRASEPQEWTTEASKVSQEWYRHGQVVGRHGNPPGLKHAAGLFSRPALAFLGEQHDKDTTPYYTSKYRAATLRQIRKLLFDLVSHHLHDNF